MIAKPGSAEAEDHHGKLWGIVRDSYNMRAARLYTPHVVCDDLHKLALSYHMEADFFRRVIMRYIVAGIIILMLAPPAIVASAALAKNLDLQSNSFIAIVTAVTSVALYAVTLIGKQIVGTREMIYAMTNRAKVVSGFAVCIDGIADNVHVEKLYEKLVDYLCSTPDSPFHPNKVASNAEMK